MAQSNQNQVAKMNYMMMQKKKLYEQEKHLHLYFKEGCVLDIQEQLDY